MSLRLKLVCALAIAAVLPMAVVVGVPLFRAEKLAQDEATARLDRVSRQAAFWIARHERETAERVAQAARSLVLDPAARRALLRGPEDAARASVRAAAERHHLDTLAVFGSDGQVLAAVGNAELPAPAELGETAGTWRSSSPPGTLAYLAVERLALDGEQLGLAGGVVAGAELVGAIAELASEPVALVDPAGAIARAAGTATPPAIERIERELPLGSTGWRLRVSTPAGDVRAVRHELWVAFAGVAPFALLSALGLGLLLAHGIARPIIALADRAEEISAERTGPLHLLPATDEVERLTVAFDGMLEALSSSERQRVLAQRIGAWQDVARRIAHEVKNPLSPIQLAVENLRRVRQKAPERFAAVFEEETAVILEEVQSLRHLVDEFSQFARLPRPQPVACDLRQIVGQVLALYAARIESGGVRVEWPDAGAEFPIRCDAEQVSRSLKNVVANALDALERVADRRLSVRVSRADGPRGSIAAIEVTDSGGGLDAETLQRVFEPYFTTRADSGGSGLGLAIAHRIVTEHGGTIHVAGARGRGATVTIRLPVDGPPPARERG